jgi:hypothetical protein
MTDEAPPGRKIMPHNRNGFERGLGPILATLSLLALASPALAGQEGNLQPAGRLLLELDAATSQFRLDDGDAATADPVQLVFDQKTLKQQDACLVGLAPDGSDPADPDALVSLADSPSEWGIDTGKLALGGRTGKGTGCGQLEFGEITRIQVNSLLLADVSVQVEAKQDVAAKVTLILDDGSAETVVGTRYLLSGRAVNNPPAEIAAADPTHVSTILANRPDGGPDSKEQDDGFWIFEAPFHNIEVYEVLTNADGTRGKLSIKGGGEFPDPSANRSVWTAFDPDGLLFCSDGFSNDSGTATGSRTNEGTCVSRIPYELDFDGFEMTFNVFDPDDQGTAYAFRVQFEPEPAAFPIPKTVLAYALEGVDCTDVDVDDPTTFTAGCIGLTLCEGTPIRRCIGTDDGCQSDSDCAEGSACRLTDLLPPAGGFPDLVADSPTTVEYGCICEEDVLYLGAGLCEDGSGCEVDADCADGSACELSPGDRMSVEQCIFALGDLKGSRRR